MIITSRAVARTRSSNQNGGSIVGNIVGCSGLANNSFSVHLAGVSGSVQLDSSRDFSFTNVATGTSTLIVQQYGMEAARQENIKVSSGSATRAGSILIKDCGGVPDIVPQP